MYNRNYFLFLFFGLLAFRSVLYAQNIAINANGNAADPSAGLDISFSNKGLLIPRVALTSSTDATTISSPATSLIVYNDGTGGLSPAGYYYNSGTAGAPIWVQLLNGGTPGTAWLTTGNSGTSVATHFIGTISNTGLVFKTNNVEQMRLQSTGQLTIGSTTAGGKLDVHQSSANDVARFTTYGNSNDLRLRRTQGTQSVPTATSAAGTILGRLTAEGYDGSGFTNAAQISFETDAAGGTSADMPGRILFYTTPDASGTLVERMRITNGGLVGINMTPSMMLDVTSASATTSDAAIRGTATANALVYGVQGRITSTTDFAAGVFGLASGTSGVINGVLGQTYSTTNNSAGVRGYAGGTSGATFGVWGENASGTANASGVYGIATSATGSTNGVWGHVSSTTADAAGVYGSASGNGAVFGVFGLVGSGVTTNTASGVIGKANATTGTVYGVTGISMSSTGIGVIGDARATTGANYGIYGMSASTGGTGIMGQATAASGLTTGVWGRVSSTTPGASGVFGEALGTSGQTAGVYGINASTGGYGVYGESTTATGTTVGVRGLSASTAGYGVYGSNTAATGMTVGVYGQNQSSSSGSGWGDADNKAAGVIGRGGTGTSQYQAGVYGYLIGSGDNSGGVVGACSLGTVWGGLGYKTGGTSYAGYFNGNVNITGSISKGSGTFKIDHPLDPLNKILYHSFVESPDMMNVYNGNIITDANGKAEVILPSYFEALNKDFRYQLTVIGQFAQAIIEDTVKNNRFTIKTDKPNVKVSWQVTGIRKDPFAEKNRVIPEVEKNEFERGKYLHPEAYGVKSKDDEKKNENAHAQEVQLRSSKQNQHILPPFTASPNKPEY